MIYHYHKTAVQLQWISPLVTFLIQSRYNGTSVYTPGTFGMAQPIPHDTTPAIYHVSNFKFFGHNKGPPLSPCREKKNTCFLILNLECIYKRTMLSSILIFHLYYKNKLYSPLSFWFKIIGITGNICKFGVCLFCKYNFCKYRHLKSRS